MFIVRLTAIITLFFMLITNSAFCAVTTHKVKDIVIDSSDRMILIRGQGNYKSGGASTYNPNTNQGVNIINNITAFSITNPARYVIDIPNSVLIGSKRNYKLQNSNTIDNIQLSQFSVNPNVVRVVFTTKNAQDISKFSTYSNGTDVVIKYAPNIIDNSIKYKFYTPQGDQDKSSNIQNTSAVISYNNSDDKIELIPSIDNKYYISKVNQGSNGLILKGLGAISIQKTQYSQDNSKAELIIDSASMASALENKTYSIPNTNKELQATLTLNKLNSKKIKLTLLADNVKDYRYIISPDGQSLFICHRSFVVNTVFTTNPIKAISYKITKNQNGYVLFDINFSNSATYDVFELNDNFYLDINNMSDYQEPLLTEAVKSSGIDIQTIKISSDKTRYIIPMKNLNFSYANVESNSKSMTLCFKQTQQKNETKVANIEIKDNKDVIYIPKEEDNNKVQKPKKNKDEMSISSLKRVVIDPGHGGSDTGAIGGGIYEKNINLEVSKLIYEKLTKKNVHVYMTRSNDTTLTLEDRVNYSNELNPDIYVSMHVNSTVALDPYGLETHYYKDDSLELAQIIHKNFASEKNLEKWDTKDRGVIKSRFYVINHTEAPSVLIEIGFLSNEIEREKLLTKKRQEEIAESVTKGILEYLKVK